MHLLRAPASRIICTIFTRGGARTIQIVRGTTSVKIVQMIAMPGPARCTSASPRR